MAKKNEIKTLARANKAPKSSDKALALLNSIESSPLATVQQSEQSIEQTPAAPVKAKEVPDGYTHYTATDTETKTVFVTCQARSREYVSALVCESPLGLIVARWSRDHKGLLREAKRILAGKGTAGLASPRVVNVQTTEAVPENAVSRQRVREAEYYALMNMTGPNHEKREQARLARAAAFAAAQANSAVQGPVEQA